MATVGKNILENITTGMYADSKIAYREYIQNACDQIDKSIKERLLEDKEGLIDIYIDDKKRYVSIKDNATGVNVESFKSIIGDIANSDKKIGENKGFRGIGKLCGLAYCKTLRFTTTFKGENIASIMECDAQKMREMFVDNKKYSLDEVLDKIVTFKNSEAELYDHFFLVEMIDINQENTDLLDEQKVISYLNFVAPVPYKNTFIFRELIYTQACNLNYKIDEYDIRVNGKRLYKEYSTNLKEQNGNIFKNYDEISDIEFKKFYDNDNNLLAWMWIGLSRFEKAIPKNNLMRGIRLRQSNIQIGNEETLKNLFKEDRGNNYFVGEVFAVDNGLIPNSQREYFNENQTRVKFEKALRTYFYESLHKLYYAANMIKSAYKKQETYIEKTDEFKIKNDNNGFVNDDQKTRLIIELKKTKEEADKAAKQLDHLSVDSESSIFKVQQYIQKKYNAIELRDKVEKAALPIEKYSKNSFASSTLSKLSKNERKLIGKVMVIITDNTTKEVGENLIKKIQEEFK